MRTAGVQHWGSSHSEARSGATQVPHKEAEEGVRLRLGNAGPTAEGQAEKRPQREHAQCVCAPWALGGTAEQGPSGGGKLAFRAEDHALTNKQQQVKEAGATRW